MRLAFRARPVVKWACSAVAALLLLIFIASGWYDVRYDAPRFVFEVGYGVVYTATHKATREGWEDGRTQWQLTQPDRMRHGTRSPYYPSWLWEDVILGGNETWGSFLIVAPWLLAVPPGIVAGVLWWRDVRSSRRRRDGTCALCGYDRRGLAIEAAACPECGALPSMSAH